MVHSDATTRVMPVDHASFQRMVHSRSRSTRPSKGAGHQWQSTPGLESEFDDDVPGLESNSDDEELSEPYCQGTLSDEERGAQEQLAVPSHSYESVGVESTIEEYNMSQEGAAKVCGLTKTSGATSADQWTYEDQQSEEPNTLSHRKYSV
jgi:hypothetical protein